MSDEFGRDVGDQRLEASVPAILLRVERGVAMDDPTHVARPMLAQEIRNPGVGSPAEQPLYRVHRIDQTRLLGG